MTAASKRTATSGQPGCAQTVGVSMPPATPSRAAYVPARESTLAKRGEREVVTETEVAAANALRGSPSAARPGGRLPLMR